VYLSVWNINVNGRKEQFATSTSNIEVVIKLYKSHFQKKYPDKAFNFESIERVTGIEVLDESTSDI
jgi:hypothetical protein